MCLLFISDSSAWTLFRGDFGLGDGGAEKILLSKIMADIGILYWFSPGQLNSPLWEGSNLAANWLWPHIFEIHQCNSINPGACRSFYCSNFDVCRVVCTNQLQKYGKIAPIDWKSNFENSRINILFLYVFVNNIKLTSIQGKYEKYDRYL